MEKAKEGTTIRRGTICSDTFLQQPNLTEEEEENILEQLQDQLFADIDQYVEETRKVQYEEFRASFKFGKSPLQNSAEDSSLTEEARATKKIRNSSVITEFKGIEDLAPPISAWENSGLQELSASVESAVTAATELSDKPLEELQKEKQEKGLSDESKRVSVLLSVGITEPATLAFAYPGSFSPFYISLLSIHLFFSFLYDQNRSGQGRSIIEHVVVMVIESGGCYHR